jgi:hypothetical protein
MVTIGFLEFGYSLAYTPYSLQQIFTNKYTKDEKLLNNIYNAIMSLYENQSLQVRLR